MEIKDKTLLIHDTGAQWYFPQFQTIRLNTTNPTVARALSLTSFRVWRTVGRSRRSRKRDTQRGQSDNHERMAVRLSHAASRERDARGGGRLGLAPLATGYSLRTGSSAWTESCSQSPHASVDVRVQAACPSSPFSVEWGKAVGAELRVAVPSHCIVPRRSDAHSLTQGPSEFAARSSQSRAWLASRESPSQPDKKERPSS